MLRNWTIFIFVAFSCAQETTNDYYFTTEAMEEIDVLLQTTTIESEMTHLEDNDSSTVTLVTDSVDVLCSECNHRNEDLSISGLHVATRNNSVLIDWQQFNETRDYCVFNYKLSVDELDFTRYGHYANISKQFTAKYCGNYVLHLDAMNKCVDTSTSVNISIVPGKIRRFKMDLNQNLITWESPEGNCTTAYRISVNNDVYLKNTNERRMDLRSWPTCQEYSVSIAAFSNVGIGPQYGPVKIVHNPMEVRFLSSVEQVDGSLIVDVIPDDTLRLCNLTYEVILSDSDEILQLLTTQPFIFNNTRPCIEYNITVSLIANHIPSEKQYLTIIREELLDDIEIDVFEVFPTNATINITLLPFNTVECQRNISIECNPHASILDENDFTKIFVDLQPFTIYSCFVDALGAINNFTFETLQDVPSGVRYLEITSIAEDSFVVEWMEPELLPGVLTFYEVIINGRPNYEKPFDDCDLPLYFNSTRTTIEGLEVNNLPPNYNYSISVKAKTIDDGPEEEIQVTTNIKRPKPVLLFSYNISQTFENKPVAHFNWKIPCDVYTDLVNIKFQVEVNWTSGEIEEHRRISRPHDTQQLDLRIQPSSDYAVRIFVLNTADGLQSLPQDIKFKAPKGNTTEPLWIDSDAGQIYSFHEFTITWMKPKEVYGNLINYRIVITRVESLHFCEIENNTEARIFNVSGGANHFKFQHAEPHQRYKIEITALTTEGYGKTLLTHFTSKGPRGPLVRNLEYIFLPRTDDIYKKSVQINIEPSCNMVYGYEYNVKLINEQGFVLNTENITNRQHKLDVQPNTYYKLEVRIVSQEFQSYEKAITFLSPVGLPAKPHLNPDQIIIDRSATTISVHLRNDYFNADNGKIAYYSILLGLKSLWVYEADNGSWNESNWSFANDWNADGFKYQASPQFWMPFKGNASITFTLGTENCSAPFVKYCNGPLKPNSEYMLIVRGLTEQTYSDSNEIVFFTLEDFQKSQTILIILGVLVSILIIVMLIGFMLLRWKRMRQQVEKKPLDDNKLKPLNLKEDGLILPESISMDNFPLYYSKCSNEESCLANEYLNLARIGEDCEITIASKQENRKKNRYVNILPYDCTRVKLDYASYDYINASYIRGYSGSVEYIATQGPLESTTADFWNMVVKEECNVVAMVAQFQEQNKVKCHKYFPENREQIELIDEHGNEITIRCSCEMDFDYYIERQIIVQTDAKVFSITHLQFLHWPDFGCPEGTSNMLQFTLILRRHMCENHCKAVIHCSAGVGRTGTLIAVDILLQTIRDRGDINIYEIVAELRRQRPKMVQAEQQYLYIYQCANDAILHPLKLAEIKAIDPIYENMENLIEMKELKIDNNNCETRNSNATIDDVSETMEKPVDCVQDTENMRTEEEETSKVNSEKQLID